LSSPQLSDALCAETLAAWEAAGRNQCKAAEAVGISRGTFQSRLRTARRREEGSPIEGGLIERDRAEVIGEMPYIVKGVSSYFNKDGDLAGQWVKTKIDEEARHAALLAAIDVRCAGILPHPPRVYLPSAPHTGLLNLVTCTDFHLGMLAWHKEGGADWDIGIARETFRACFGGMLRMMPKADVCVINQLGDYLHFDGMKAVTPEHGNILDADSRFQKVADIAVDLLEELVLMALETHERVHVAPMEGNHDESSSAWLRIIFRRLFRDEPRVSVEDSPLPYAIYQHGKQLLGFHHGHKQKPDQLPELFAAQFRKEWGTSEFCHIHSGHQHHLYEKERSGATVLQHPTLAARDAYAARGGWIADRRAIGITYHAETGEVGRTIVKPDMFGL